MEFTTKEQLWIQRFHVYMLKHCDDKGRILLDNMSKSERRGYFKLLKRVKAKEIVVSTTDKSGELTISTYQAYIEMGIPHTKNDLVVTWKEIKEAKHLLETQIFFCRC